VRKLIVNADGFGFTFGNNRAILEVLRHGFVQSVSVNVTWPAVQEVPVLMRDFPHVSIGVHLNLSVGPPVLPPTEIPSLVGPDGEFRGKAFPRLAMKRRLDRDEMKRELRAQVRVLRERGVPITHWDSHQGRHLFPGFFEAALEVGREEGIPASRTHRYYLILPRGVRFLQRLKFYARHPRQIATHAMAARRMRRVRRAGTLLPDWRLVIEALGPDAPFQAEAWQRMLDTVPRSISMVICHPGYVDEDLRRYSTWLEPREKERVLLDDPLWTTRAAEANVEPVSYHDLLKQSDAAGGD